MPPTLFVEALLSLSEAILAVFFKLSLVVATWTDLPISPTTDLRPKDNGRMLTLPQGLPKDTQIFTFGSLLFVRLLEMPMEMDILT